MRIRFCPYTGKYESEKARISVIELLVIETIEKSYQNYFLLKLSSFLLFLFAASKSSQKQTRDGVLKNGC